MAIINAYTLVRVLSFAHLTAAWVLLTAPSLLSEQTYVVVLGEAMRLPTTSGLTKPSEATALSAFLFTMIAISDLVGASLPEITALEYWTTQVPVRLAFLFIFSAYVYLFKEDGMFGSGVGSWVSGKDRGPGMYLKNDLLFSVAFIEMCAWFWVYISMRDERRKFADKLAEKRAFEDEFSK